MSKSGFCYDVGISDLLYQIRLVATVCLRWSRPQPSIIFDQNLRKLSEHLDLVPKIAYSPVRKTPCNRGFATNCQCHRPAIITCRSGLLTAAVNLGGPRRVDTVTAPRAARRTQAGHYYINIYYIILYCIILYYIILCYTPRPRIKKCICVDQSLDVLKKL